MYNFNSLKTDIQMKNNNSFNYEFNEIGNRTHNHSLTPFPNSWYAVSFSVDLKPGKILTTRFCGDEVILFRTETGKAVMMEAYCPHLGAHFGHGGVVVKDTIVCPFHAFRFDENGKCIKTGYGTKPPPKANVKVWKVEEQHGVIFAYHGKKSLPDWQIPTLNNKNWSAFKFHKWRLKSNPQEIAENSVDIGHFRLVHGYTNIRVIEPLKTNGSLLTASYGFSRKAPIGNKTIDVEFSIQQWGLGYALVDAHTLNYNMHSRHLVMPSPIDGTDIYLRIGVSVRKDLQLSKIHPLLDLLPLKLLVPLICNTYLKHFKDDVYDDFKIWKNKICIDKPRLAKGDGPIMRYRKWAAQFHPIAGQTTKHNQIT